jgi:fatty acid/phospholipid biosynthesis enzyme
VRGKIGASILKPNLRRIKQRVDHAEHGGGLLLGVAGVTVISHGSSQAPSVFNAIRLAKEALTTVFKTAFRPSTSGLPCPQQTENNLWNSLCPVCHWWAVVRLA